MPLSGKSYITFLNMQHPSSQEIQSAWNLQDVKNILFFCLFVCCVYVFVYMCIWTQMKRAQKMSDFLELESQALKYCWTWEKLTQVSCKSSAYSNPLSHDSSSLLWLSVIELS